MPEHFTNPASTVDLIVPYKEGIILIRRKNAPFKGYWALPGGFLDYNQESLEEAAVRELEEETGLKANKKDLNLIEVYSDPPRDPRDHIIAHIYCVNKYEGKLCARDDAADAKVFKKLPEKLAFDHSKILNDYYNNYRK